MDILVEQGSGDNSECYDNFMKKFTDYWGLTEPGQTQLCAVDSQAMNNVDRGTAGQYGLLYSRKPVVTGGCTKLLGELDNKVLMHKHHLAKLIEQCRWDPGSCLTA